MSPISSADIQTLLDAGRLVEAGTLLTMHGEELEPQERQTLETMRQELWSQATVLVAEGEALEQEGKNAAAQECYLQAAGVASDFPGIQEHCKRIDEMLTLANAVRLRSKRIRAQAKPADRTGKTKRAFAPLVVGFLLLGLGGGAWWYLGQPETKQKSLSPVSTAPITADTPLIPAADSPAVATTAQPSASNDREKPETEQVAQAPENTVPQPNTVEPAPMVAALPATDTPPVAPSPEKKPEPTVSLASEMPAPTAPLSQNAPTVTVQESSPLSEPEPTAPPVSMQSPPTETPPSVQAQDNVYTVQPGDSLSKIAQRLLCNPDAWHQLHTLNRDQIKNPHILIPGIQIRLSGIKNNCRKKQ
ncbi:MAG: LysM peptidoglycan-binding domain-containing protein [Desulfobulbus sp.]